MNTLHFATIIGITIVFFGSYHTVYAPCAVGITDYTPPDPLFLTDDKGRIDNFLTNHQILIRYDAWTKNPDSKSMNLEINFTSDSGPILDDKEQITLESGKPTSIIWKFIPTKAGQYTIEKFSNGTHTSTTYFSITDSGEPTSFSVLVSPLRQFKFGIAAENIQCDQNFVLLINTNDHSPACVKLKDASNFITRGWVQAPPTRVPELLEQIQQPYGNATLPASFEPCNTSYPQNSTGIAVLYMPANSTGKLCVRYHNLDDNPIPIGIRISEANNLDKDATEITTWNDSENNTLLKGDSTVVYWIKTGNHAGLYGLTLFCVPMPLAVGYDNNSTFVKSDFPWLGSNTWFCPAQYYDFHIDSLSGIGIKYIP